MSSVQTACEIPHLKDIQHKLMEWGKHHLRVFPWRETRDPWKILLAEVLLHRTQSLQVLPVYRVMIERFPSPEALALASEKELYDIMHSLGLHWRIPLLLQMARHIVQNYRGKVPETLEELHALPGVSHYIAGAVMVIAYGNPAPVVDTNVVRILGRLLGIPVRESSRKQKRFHRLSRCLVDGPDPRLLFLSLIDLGALICRPHNTECFRCPLQEFCKYAAKERQDGHSQ